MCDVADRDANTRDTGGYPVDARKRLGDLIERARTTAVPMISQKKVGGDTVTYARLRDGLPVRWSTVRRAETALGWATFAADDILGGATDPRLAAPGEERDEHAVVKRRGYEEAGLMMEGLAATTDEEYAVVTEILAHARARGRGQTRSN